MKSDKLDERERIIDGLRAELAQARAHARWIPVDTELPAACVRVLVCYDATCEENEMAVCCLDRGLWWLDACHALDDLYTKVHHWMPLPDAPH
jgi:hypothetical protein